LSGDGACDPVITKEDWPLRLTLDLKDGGDGAMYSGGGVYEMSLPSRCLKEGYCESYGYKSDSQCGRCTYTTDIASGASNELHWTRTSTQLTLDHVYDYCVNGDGLSLHAPQSTAVVVLKRAQLVGQPHGCFARPLEACVQPGDRLDACHTGACIGDLSCSGAAKQADCTNRKGCSWDLTKCDGTAATSCAIQDYGVIPGCDVMTPP
jgi:hypothetical protein